jgi:hypothetical protein
MDKFAGKSSKVNHSRSRIEKQNDEEVINRFEESLNDPMLHIELQSETAKGIFGLKEKARNGLTDSQLERILTIRVKAQNVVNDGLGTANLLHNN